MNLADVVVLSLMVTADICLLVHLRRRRARYIRMDRMTRSLQIHLRGLEVDPLPLAGNRPLSHAS